MTSLVSSELREAVGRMLSRRVSFPVSESDIRRWAVAVYWPEDPPRHFVDVAYAEATRPQGFVAPAEFNPFAWLVTESEQLGEMPPFTYEYRLNGGVSMSYGEPMRPGDVITGVRSLADISERAGRRGRMLIVVTADRWTNQRGQFVKLHHFTAIHFVGGDD